MSDKAITLSYEFRATAEGGHYAVRRDGGYKRAHRAECQLCDHCLMTIVEAERVFLDECKRNPRLNMANVTELCRMCKGTGTVYTSCDDPQCGDSTWDHDCNAGEQPCDCTKRGAQ